MTIAQGALTFVMMTEVWPPLLLHGSFFFFFINGSHFEEFRRGPLSQGMGPS